MEANMSTVKMLPLEGDYATGVRAQSEFRAVRGNFASGMSGSTASLVRHHGDFAAGIRSHLPDLHHPGDFAGGVRVSDSPAAA